MTDRRSRTARLTLGAVAAATLTLAGCSGGGDWPTTGGAASAAPGASVTAPTTDAGVGNAAGSTTGGTDAATGNGGAGGSGTGGGSGSGASGGGASDGGGNPDRCTTAELRGSLGPADGAAGSVNQTLVLTNTGARTCYLRGFPGVSYVGGDNGAQVGPSAVMVGARGGDIRLVAGGSARAAMQLANVANFDAAQCRPVAVRGLRVYPPGDTASLFVPRAGTGCSATPSGGNQLTVQTLTAR